MLYGQIFICSYKVQCFELYLFNVRKENGWSDEWKREKTGMNSLIQHFQFVVAYRINNKCIQRVGSIQIRNAKCKWICNLSVVRLCIGIIQFYFAHQANNQFIEEYDATTLTNHDCSYTIPNCNVSNLSSHWNRSFQSWIKFMKIGHYTPRPYTYINMHTYLFIRSFWRQFRFHARRIQVYSVRWMWFGLSPKFPFNVCCSEREKESKTKKVSPLQKYLEHNFHQLNATQSQLFVIKRKVIR